MDKFTSLCERGALLPASPMPETLFLVPFIATGPKLSAADQPLYLMVWYSPPT